MGCWHGDPLELEEASDKPHRKALPEVLGDQHVTPHSSPPGAEKVTGFMQVGHDAGFITERN